MNDGQEFGSNCLNMLQANYFEQQTVYDVTNKRSEKIIWRTS